MSADLQLPENYERTSISEEARLKIKKLVTYDPWYWAWLIAKTGKGFVERFHRPILYYLTHSAELLAACLFEKRFESEFTRQMREELRRLGIDPRTVRGMAKFKRYLRRTNLRVARSMGKTTLGYTALSYLGMMNPNETIAIASKSDPAAEKILKPIADIYRSPDFAFYFPELIPTRNIDTAITQTKITLAGRTVPVGEALFEARGINSVWAGYHYSIIYADDVIGAESGDASQDDALRWLANVPSISINPALGGTWEKYTGTIYGARDDHRVICDDFHTLRVVIPIWIKKRTGVKFLREDGVATLPEWYDEEWITMTRDRILANPKQGPIWFLQNYELHPFTDGASIFFEDTLMRQRFVQHTDLAGRTLIARPRTPESISKPIGPVDWVLSRPEEMAIYMGVDQSVSLAKNADSWAISIVAFDAHGHSYVLDCVKGRGYPLMLDTLRLIRLRYPHVLQIGIDSAATQSMTLELAKRDPNLQALSTILVPLQGGNRRKDERLLTFFAARLEMGEMWINPELTGLINEAVEYEPADDDPVDDQLDSVAMAVAVGLPGSAISSEEMDSLLDEAQDSRDQWVDGAGVHRDSWLNLF